MENNINKFSDIKNEIECPNCHKGTRKLKMLHVHPKKGRVGMEYSWCSYCENKYNLMNWSDIVIPELKIGDI